VFPADARNQPHPHYKANAAIKATVNSGNEVEKAIKLNPTAVFPIRVIVANFTALLMARLDAQFSTRKETAMTKMSKMNPEQASKKRVWRAIGGEAGIALGNDKFCFWGLARDRKRLNKPHVFHLIFLK
jgi:hypothetical protein